MNIKFSPIFSRINVDVKKSGDSLIINGIIYDFSQLKDGEILLGDAIDCEYIEGDVERVNGSICLTLIRPYTISTQENCFPESKISAEDGVIL